MASFGSRLKELRTLKGLSQGDLSKVLKVTRSCIGNYEQGKREPNFEDLEKIADYFNVDMNYLLGKSDVPRVNPIDYLFELSSEDQAILEAYHRQPVAVQNAICDMLHVKKDSVSLKEA